MEQIRGPDGRSTVERSGPRTHFDSVRDRTGIHGARRANRAHISMMDGLRSQLPAELLERVLSLLPVPDLCRFRSVCKGWNSLICKPVFGKICIQNAIKGSNLGAYLVVKLHADYSVSERSTEIPRWSIFDLNARRWYNIQHQLPMGYDPVGPAMDGGLLCTFVDPFTDEQRREPIRIHNPLTIRDRHALIISNPVDGKFKVLPAPPMDGIFLTGRVNLKLFVESTSNTYKIFLLNSSSLGGPWMCIYDSAVNQWRIPPNRPLEWNEFGTHLRSAMFQGLLYVLLYRAALPIYWLYSFNYLDDALEDTGVQFLQSAFDYCDLLVGREGELDCIDLVVSDNRLFLTAVRIVPARSTRPVLKSAFVISEIQLADKVCRTVVQMGDAELRENFSISQYVCQFTIRAFGFDKSILVMCEETGKVMLYDLVIGAWEFLHANPGELPLMASIAKSELETISRHGMQTSYLRLPNTPW